MKQSHQEFIKTLIAVIGLTAVLLFSYFAIKRQKEFDPFSLKLNTSKGMTTLSELNKDKIVLLYFGFLSCPDACPTTLSTMSAVFKQLTPDQLDKITFLFIDLDPERDTMAKLKEYTSFFHPKILPVSLNPVDLDLFTKYFGIAYMRVPLKSTMGYTIDHSTHIITLDPQGKFLDQLEHGTSAKLITLKLNKILNEKGTK